MDTATLLPLLTSARVMNAEPNWGPHVQAVANQLAVIPELQPFADDMQFKLGLWSRSSHIGLAKWLIERSGLVGPEQTLKNLSEYLECEGVPIAQHMLFTNITTPIPIQLPWDISMIPLGEQPHSYQRDLVLRSFLAVPHLLQSSVALTKTRTFEYKFRLAGTALPTVDDDWERLADAGLLLSLIGPSAPVCMGSFAQMPDWVPDIGGGGAASYYGVELPPLPLPHKEDWASVAPLMDAWMKRTPAQREHFRVPLRRLNYAIRRWSDVDRAIDLGVALEATFLNDREPDRGELSFTIRLRASRYMGLDKAARLQVAKSVAFLYRLRSIAVHTGTIKGELDGQNTHEALKAGISFTAAVLTKQILNGLPDWSDIVYG